MVSTELNINLKLTVTADGVTLDDGGKVRKFTNIDALYSMISGITKQTVIDAFTMSESLKRSEKSEG